jgi:hypothetical protein
MCRDRITSFGEVRGKLSRFVGPSPFSTGSVPSYAERMTGPRPQITALQLPIEWDQFGWSETPSLGGIVLTTGDPKWGWEPAAPVFEIHTLNPPHAEPVDGFAIDHVVLLVPSLDKAIGTLERIGLTPRLRMAVKGRPAAFFRAGPVLEVVESPVRQASVYGIAVTAEEPLESLAIGWRSRGLSIGDVKPAIQPSRRIFTVHDLDAGFAVMSPDTDIR